jgi:hypothetical protein
MTCREKLQKDYPDKVGGDYIAGCCCCPDDYGYLDSPDFCTRKGDEVTCTKCWDREIPETNTDTTPHIKDSGERREFDTGAVRDIQEGKGRCDLMPLDVVAEYLNDQIIRYIGQFQQTGDAIWLNYALENIERDDPYTIVLEVAKHFEEGAKKYGEYNWQKGIPTHCYIDSAVRHYLKDMRGDNDEPHDRAFVWNLLCCIWTCHHKPELNDYAQNNNMQGE